MDLMELSNLSQMGLIGLAIILAGLIKIPKLELNIWNLIGRTIGRSINKEAMDQATKNYEEINTRVDNFAKEINTQIKGISDKVDDLEKAGEL